MQFIASRKKFYYISGISLILSLFFFFFLPKHLGIDMTGGLQIEYSSSSPIQTATLGKIRSDIIENYTFNNTQVISDLLVYSVNLSSIRTDIGLTASDDVAYTQERNSHIRASLPKFFAKEGITVTELSFVAVGQSFGKFVIDRAYLTLGMCLVAIALYLMFAFRKSIQGTSSFTFGAVTLATLIHDIVVAAGIYVLLGLIFPALKIDTFFVTAILTILGYSINDTIVILDRIRATYRDKKPGDSRSSKQIFEDSIQVSLRRSIYTSMTLFIVLLIMLIFGPEALKGFVTLMLLGTLVGTYSSICIAAPMLYDINRIREKQ